MSNNYIITETAALAYNTALIPTNFDFTLQSPFVVQKRFAKAIHIKGRTPPYRRRLLQSVLEPVVSENVPERDWWRCKGQERPIDYTYSPLVLNEINGLQKVVVRIVKEKLQQNSVLIICQRLPCLENDLKIMGADLYDYGLRYDYMVIDRVMRVALQDTPLASLIPLMYTKMVFYFAAEFNPPMLVRAFKRMHYALPLAIVVDQQAVLAKSQVEQLAREAPKGILDRQAQLSALLSNPTTLLVSTCSHAMMQLANNLSFLQQEQNSPVAVAVDAAPAAAATAAEASKAPEAGATKAEVS